MPSPWWLLCCTDARVPSTKTPMRNSPNWQKLLQFFKTALDHQQQFLFGHTRLCAENIFTCFCFFKRILRFFAPSQRGDGFSGKAHTRADAWGYPGAIGS
jgi:hypothetical protein